MFGYLIPKSYKEALEFDKENNNTKWADATRDKMDCIKEQQVFTKGPRAKWDSQHKKIINAPPNHQKIRVNLIFAVKYNGRHKARLVADGSLTPEPAENIYSGVVSLRHLRLVIFLGELNNLELWGADIGNAYLEAHTQEKLFIIGGAEFEELQGFILIFNKALYGLKSSGKRWAEKFYDIIKDMGFTPSKADPCIWMRENKTLKCYEYLAIYVDDLCIAAQDPGQIIQSLKEDFKLKVKGDGPLSHHLGADYTRDKDNALVCQPKKYIERLAESYHSMFKQNPPKNMRTPLNKNDHPELDDSELLKGDSIQHYLTMIGQLQWLVTLGRFDIHAQVTTMSKFRSAPRKGHLERLQRIYGYVLKTKHYSTRYRTEEPDYTYLPDMKHDWTYTVYGNTQEIIPHDCPKPLGKSVTTTTTLDGNLLHCMATGASLTACLHFCNHTPTDWYSKKQATVETATYGSEFLAWMRPEPGGTCYEYIAVYVDDLVIAAKDPQAFCHELKKKYNLKLKSGGPLEYHLGCTYKKDPDGTLAADPRRYVNKILQSYERMFKEKPRKSRPQLEGGDHPELDTSELCDEHQIKQFQTLIGQLQWLISLGRFDIAVHVMSLSRIRAQPRKGHLDRAKRIVGYLLFLPD